MTAATMSSDESRQTTSGRRASGSGRAAAWANRYLTPFLTAIAVLALSAALVFTIYFTQLDLQWTAFLFGVLFAAVLSMVTQSVKAQWRLVRRSAQLRRSKELLAEEVARRERSAQALKVADVRFRTILDALPVMIFFVDREERCLYYNAAFQEGCSSGTPDMSAMPLRELVDDAMYQHLSARGKEALLGRETQFEARWRHPAGEKPVAVKLLPYPVGAQMTSGFYVFVTPAADAMPAAARGIAPEAAGEAVYFGAMEQQLTTDEDPREYLLRAIEADQFILLEQKIEPLTAEAAHPNFREILVRLREEEERTLAPGGFFEVAERYDLMPAIDRWVIRKLLRSCAAMKSADPAWRMPLYCVNLGGATLSDRGFASHVQMQLKHWDIAGHRICFEVNQGELAEREADIVRLMAQLKPLGCRFTVDGFGSQKVSFAPFRNLRFDFLKIDGSIVSEILKKPSELAKARAIVLACGKLEVRTIAQFVEDEGTRVRLREIGVDYVQGFGIDKPGPLAVMAPMAGTAAV